MGRQWEVAPDPRGFNTVRLDLPVCIPIRTDSRLVGSCGELSSSTAFTKSNAIRAIWST